MVASARAFEQNRPELVRKLVLVEGGPDFRDQADGVPSNADPIKRSAVTEKFFEAGDIDGGLRYAVNDISGPGRWDSLSETYRQNMRQNAWTVVGIGRDASRSWARIKSGPIHHPSR